MTLSRIGRRALLSGGAIVLAPLATPPGRAARAQPSPGGVALAEFTTGYDAGAEHAPRAFNVELAASAIDGKSLPPAGVFSFNDVVGERTAAYGYRRAVVLRRGMIAEGVGGGTCQVASTLHAAALLAGLRVVSRAPHSRPSAYIRMGLDATVVYPEVDLRLANPRSSRVVLRAHAERGTLRVSVVADAPPRPRVTITSEVVYRAGFPRSVLVDGRVPEGEVHVRAHGIPGYTVVRAREVSTDGVTTRDERTDVYPPTAEVIVVAPTFDVTRLDQREAEDTPDGVIAPAVWKDEPGVAVPALVQMRPSTRVVVDNGG